MIYDTVMVTTPGRICGEAEARLGVSMIYDTRYPHQVRLAFQFFNSEDAPTEWLVSRETVAGSLYAKAGMGDVTMWPDEAGEIALHLNGRSSKMTIWLVRDDVVTFVSRTVELVPFGQEVYPHLDDDLISFLAEEAGL